MLTKKLFAVVVVVGGLFVVPSQADEAVPLASHLECVVGCGSANAECVETCNARLWACVDCCHTKNPSATRAHCGTVCTDNYTKYLCKK